VEVNVAAGYSPKFRKIQTQNLSFSCGVCWKKAIAAESDWNSEHVALTGELSFNDKDILPVWRFSMEALVDCEMFILQGEYFISLHIGED
jgi:hypothetical protein